MVRYTTKPAFEYATKWLESMSSKDPKDKVLKSMKGKKIKVVIKIFEQEDDEEEAPVKKSKKGLSRERRMKKRRLL